ncbi:branched-chain amino acid ABC transporter permease [Chloroflexota bacterium]
MQLPAGTYNISYGKDMAVVRTKTQWGLLIVLLICLFTVVPLFANGFWLSICMSIAIGTITVHGLNIMFGYCGLPSLGHFGFMAIGAYATALLTSNYGLPFWLAIPCAGIAAAIVGGFFGLGALRIKGFYIAVTTLAAQFIIGYIIVTFPDITGGIKGIHLPTPKLGSIVFDTDKVFYFIPMVTAVLMTFFALNLSRSRVGRAFVAIRDNDIAAQAMGIRLFPYKMLAFCIGCFYAGIAGSLLAYQITHISAEAFTGGWALMESIWLLGTLVIGGMGSTVGPIFGVILVEGLRQFSTWAGPELSYAFPNMASSLQAAFSPLLFGIVLMLFLVFEPRGLAHRWWLLKTSYRLYPFST